MKVPRPRSAAAPEAMGRTGIRRLFSSIIGSSAQPSRHRLRYWPPCAAWQVPVARLSARPGDSVKEKAPAFTLVPPPLLVMRPFPSHFLLYLSAVPIYARSMIPSPPIAAPSPPGILAPRREWLRAEAECFIHQPDHWSHRGKARYGPYWNPDIWPVGGRWGHTSDWNLPVLFDPEKHRPNALPPHPPLSPPAEREG